ncbi:MAG: histidine phosphatase family protein [Alphaproteobacteria bacterium]|nr:histidine phosphatase family protein [Alphaproteobacteria bacterium]
MEGLIETRFWLVRHAPVVGQQGRCYGTKDVECDTTNAAAFAGLARIVPDSGAWHVTPLSRTRRTADAIWAAKGGTRPAFTVAEGMIEQCFGDWQGRTYVELGAYGFGAPEKSHRHWLTMAEVKPDGGESFKEVCARVSKALDALATANRGKDVPVVCHGGTIRAAVAHALAIEPEKALAMTVDTLSVTRVDRLEGAGVGHSWRVGFVNRAPC